MTHSPRAPVVAFAVALLSALVGGCIGVETTYELTTGGSGTMTISYQVSQFVTKLATAAGERGGVPLPLTAGDLADAVRGAPGVSIVQDPQQREDEENITITAKLGFDTPASLSEIPGFERMPAELSRDGSNWRFRLTLTEDVPPEERIDAQSLDIIRTLFSGYVVSIRVRAPSDIVSANLGQIAGREVDYRITIPDLLEITEKTDLEVVW